MIETREIYYRLPNGLYEKVTEIREQDIFGCWRGWYALSREIIPQDQLPFYVVHADHSRFK